MARIDDLGRGRPNAISGRGQYGAAGSAPQARGVGNAAKPKSNVRVISSKEMQSKRKADYEKALAKQIEIIKKSASQKTINAALNRARAIQQAYKATTKK